MTEQLTCPNCGNTYNYDPKDRKGARKYACSSCRTKVRRLRRKREIVEEFGGKCRECGYNECHRALTFHHTEPENKEFEINSGCLLRAWDDLVAEASKCELLCANCHAQRHCDVCSDEMAELKDKLQS